VRGDGWLPCLVGVTSIVTESSSRKALLASTLICSEADFTENLIFGGSSLYGAFRPAKRFIGPCSSLEILTFRLDRPYSDKTLDELIYGLIASPVILVKACNQKASLELPA